MASISWTHYELEVIVIYTAPPSAAQKICLDGGFDIGQQVQGGFNLSEGLFGSAGSSSISGSFNPGLTMNGNSQTQLSLRGNLLSCD